MKKHKTKKKWYEIIKRVKKDNDFKILTIITIFAFLFGFSLVFLDLGKPTFIDKLTTPFARMNYMPDSQGVEIVNKFDALRYTIGSMIFNLLLGAIYMVPLIVYVVITMIANGSLLAHLTLSGLGGIKLIITSILYTLFVFKLSYLSLKLGRYVIYLTLKKEFEIESDVLKYMSLKTIVLLILYLVVVLL